MVINWGCVSQVVLVSKAETLGWSMRSFLDVCIDDILEDGLCFSWCVCFADGLQDGANQDAHNFCHPTPHFVSKMRDPPPFSKLL